MICQTLLHLFFVLSVDVFVQTKPFDVIYSVLLYSLSINYTSVSVLGLSQERLDNMKNTATKHLYLYLHKLGCHKWKNTMS